MGRSKVTTHILIHTTLTKVAEKLPFCPNSLDWSAKIRNKIARITKNQRMPFLQSAVI